MKSFTDAFDYIKALAGVNNFTTQEKANIKILLNRRLKVAYNAHEAWKQYTVAGEERFFAPKTLTIENSGADTVTLYWAGMTSGFPLYTTPTPQVQGVVGGLSVHTALYKTISTEKTDGGVFIVTPGEWRYVKETTLTATSLNFLEPWTAEVNTPVDQSEYVAQTVNTYGEFLPPLDNSEPDLSKETAYPHLTTNTWFTSLDGLTNTFKVTGSDMAVVPYTEQLSTGNPYQKHEVSTFQRVFKEYPYQRKSSLEYDFHVNSGGALPINLIESPNSVYVTYKKTYIDQTFALESEDVKVIDNTFFQYACYATYADFLRFDGQLSKALTEEQIAQGFLDTEMEKVDIMNNSNLNFRVQTHLSHQSR